MNKVALHTDIWISMDDKYLRFNWALECMQLQPADTVLEVGPGAGLALELISGRVRSLAAVERSGAMLKRVRERFGATDDFRGIEGDLLKVDLSGYRFTKVFAFNVSGFLKNESMFRVLRPHLTKDGYVGIFFQNPPGSPGRKLESMIQQLKRQAEKAHFEIVNEFRMSSSPATPTGGVIFRPAVISSPK